MACGRFLGSRTSEVLPQTKFAFLPVRQAHPLPPPSSPDSERLLSEKLCPSVLALVVGQASQLAEMWVPATHQQNPNSWFRGLYREGQICRTSEWLCWFLLVCGDSNVCLWVRGMTKQIERGQFDDFVVVCENVRINAHSAQITHRRTRQLAGKIPSTTVDKHTHARALGSMMLRVECISTPNSKSSGTQCSSGKCRHGVAKRCVIVWRMLTSSYSVGYSTKKMVWFKRWHQCVLTHQETGTPADEGNLWDPIEEQIVNIVCVCCVRCFFGEGVCCSFGCACACPVAPSLFAGEVC